MTGWSFLAFIGEVIMWTVKSAVKVVVWVFEEVDRVVEEKRKS